jgi:uncharacterized protein YbbC (DUF1343 family)
VHIGIGTPEPFQRLAASWIDPERLARQLNAYRLPGIQFDPSEWDLNHSATDGREVRGVRVRINQPATAPLVAINICALEAIQKTAGRDLFQQAAQRGKNWTVFDKVAGSDQLRRALQAGKAAREIVNSWRANEQAFAKQREPYLLYRE